jgi:nucleotide-binding universal stress UspA family protein
LRWAATEAARLDAQLKIVLAWRIDPRAYYAPAISPGEHERRQERAVSGLAATVRAELGPGALDAGTTRVVQGIPERALVEESTAADLLVLGSASAAVTGRSIGAVIRACLSHAHCPVVVVGPEGQNTGPMSGLHRSGADPQTIDGAIEPGLQLTGQRT